MPSIPEFRLRWREDRQQFYVFWTEGRTTKRISTRTADESEARRFVAELMTGWDTPADPDKVTVKRVVEHYLEDKKREIAGRRLPHRNYQSLEFALKPILAFFGDMFTASITRNHSRQYIARQQDAGLSNATIKKQLDIFVAAMNHAKHDGWIPSVPKIEKPQPPAPRDKWATADQVRQFIDAIETPHVRLFALLALHTLARKTAILELRWSQIDFSQRIIHYNQSGRTVTAKRRVPVPINNTLLVELKKACDVATTEFVIEHNGKSVADNKKAFARWAEEAGLPWITPHVLRHTGATLMAQKGVAMWEIAGIMGDRLDTVEKHYAKHHPDYLKGATSALDELYGG